MVFVVFEFIDWLVVLVIVIGYILVNNYYNWVFEEFGEVMEEV